MTIIQIEQHIIGEDNPCFVIAEAGVNHNGELALAYQLIDAAVAAGADAVKFQTFIAEEVVTPNSPKAEYQLAQTDVDESQFEMLKRLELRRDWHTQLMTYCQNQGILFLSTAFDVDSADFLHDLGVAAFKIPSGEITNFPLLRHIAGFKKPIILSTGMADLDEVAIALRVLQENGATEIAVLHCVSNYPANPSDTNLRAMETMRNTFQVPVGYSDHTLGIEVPIAAVGLGACIIEKHFTLKRDLPGPDHQASLEPHELKAMVTGIRTVQLALGDGVKRPVQSELATAAIARRSIVATQDLPKGTVIQSEHLALRRPGTGTPPNMLPEFIGRTLTHDVTKGTLLHLDMLQ